MPYLMCPQPLVLQSLCCCLVAQSCLTLRDPTDCSTPGSPVLHYCQGFAQTHVHRVSDAIQPSHVTPFSSCPQSFPASGKSVTLGPLLNTLILHL